MNNKTFKELFDNTDLIIIIDSNGRVMYYEDYNDNINMLKSQNVLGRSIFELYPYFKREEFTVFKAMDQKKPILNEYQTFNINGVGKSALNSAFPLINDSGVVGAIVFSVELPRNPDKKKKDKLIAKYSFSDILTQDSYFKKNLNFLEKVSENDSNILIMGETGTGKEMVAHSIHQASKRRERPLIIQNCASIPHSIMESILFGTSRGSFTGAIDKEGIFEAAKGGTIFLDEINSMPLDLQSKVLRAIESKTVSRIGETKERDVDVRIIAAANEDLSEKVAGGTFREDLYYRLNVVRFTIPPLRERPGDVPLLAAYYIELYNNRFHREVTGFTAETERILTEYPWKGNVRELKNVVEFILNVKESGSIKPQDLPSYMKDTVTIEDGEISSLRGPACVPGMPLKTQLEDYEKALLKDAVKACRYNIRKTAEYLNVPRQTLYYKLNKYEIL